MHAHGNTIHNSQEVDIALVSINGWMDKQIVVYSTYSGIFLSHKNEVLITLQYKYSKMVLKQKEKEKKNKKTKRKKRKKRY